MKNLGIINNPYGPFYAQATFCRATALHDACNEMSCKECESSHWHNVTMTPSSPSSTTLMTSSYTWSLPFLHPIPLGEGSRTKIALVILNQPLSKPLLSRLWHASDWRCCADGGANRLHDCLAVRTIDRRPTSPTF